MNHAMPATPLVTNRFARRDQAAGLRAALHRQSLPAADAQANCCRAIAVTSGKGGVGKSHLALNLAVALAQHGRRVCLVDGNLGLGNLDLLCGLNGYWNLSHVVSGARLLNDVLLRGPAGIHLIPGGSGIADLADCPPHVQKQLLRELQSLEAEHDVLLIDTGSGIHPLARQFALAADDILLVTTPEPTAIADAYATIKSLSVAAASELHVAVNQVDSAEQAQQVLERLQQTARLFLRVGLGRGGWIPRDPAVSAAAWQRTPFLLLDEQCPAAKAVRQLAEQLANSGAPAWPRGSFFQRLWPRLALATT
jgi:flagellar biosynthesis protein FlhG